MKQLTDLLFALKTVLTQYHLLAQDYQNHLQAERIGSDIDEIIDRCKEFYLGIDGDKDIAYSKKSLEGALAIISALPSDKTPKEWATHLLARGITLCEQFNLNGYPKRAAENLIGDISEKLCRMRYLIKLGVVDE